MSKEQKAQKILNPHHKNIKKQNYAIKYIYDIPINLNQTSYNTIKVWKKKCRTQSIYSLYENIKYSQIYPTWLHAACVILAVPSIQQQGLSSKSFHIQNLWLLSPSPRNSSFTNLPNTNQNATSTRINTLHMQSNVLMCIEG